MNLKKNRIIVVFVIIVIAAIISRYYIQQYSIAHDLNINGGDLSPIVIPGQLEIPQSNNNANIDQIMNRLNYLESQIKNN